MTDNHTIHWMLNVALNCLCLGEFSLFATTNDSRAARSIDLACVCWGH